MGPRQPLEVTVRPFSVAPPTRAAADARADFSVALLSMPFGPQLMPSIQIGLLASIAREAGFTATPMHLGLDFAALIDPTSYDKLAREGTELANWLFSVAAFGDAAPDPDGNRLSAFAGPALAAFGTEDEAVRRLRSLRQDAEDFIDDLVESIDWSRFSIVGFSTTYQQKTASFALARRIKERWPDVRTLFGGAHFDQPMGHAWMEAIPWIDLGITGEADQAFPELLIALVEGRDPLSVPGVLGRDGTGRTVSGPPTRPLEELDWLPIPDFEDFFERAERLRLLRPGRVRDVEIPFEAARGCWWGEKNHCTFCGISDDILQYRSKSARTVERELAEQVRRYGSFRFLNTDLILDMGHLEELLGTFARQGTDFSFWWEVKASLTREQVRTLQRGGLHSVQPGIESLDSHSLRLMHKGTRSSDNVNLLRWCAYYGIDVKWNRIYGFPGESIDALHAEADLVRSLHHLCPPGNMAGISIDRFSPIFEDAERFPRSALRPTAGYAAVYPPTVDLERAAFSFDADLEGVLPRSAYGPLKDAYRVWGEAAIARPRPTLRASTAPGVLHVADRRWRHDWTDQVFEGVAAATYRACFERPRSVRHIVDELSTDPDQTGKASPTSAAVEAALERFLEDRLVMKDGNLFLALALPATPYR